MNALDQKHRKDIEKTMERLDSSFFFYDLDHLANHLDSMRKVLDPNIKLWYACKANPMSAILKVFRNLDFGIDVASQGELDQVLRAGIKPEGVISTGPSKSRKYLKSLIQNEIKVVVCESINQTYWLNDIAKESGVRPQVLLRVQLDWGKGSSVLGGDAITPFGIGVKDWEALDKSRTQYLNIIGLHAFQWGNILNLFELEKIWTETIFKLKTLSEKINIPLKVLDLGGGIGIPYFGDSTIPVSFNDVHDILMKLKVNFDLDQIWMELGRYAVGSCGHYFSQIIDRKNVRGKELLILDGGINHIARPPLTNQYFPCQLFRKSHASNKPFQVHGPLCTALDHLGNFDLPEDSAIGDWLVFNQVGAYGFTEAMPFFLCHNLPGEVISYKGSFMTPRPIKTAADWMV